MFRNTLKTSKNLSSLTKRNFGAVTNKYHVDLNKKYAAHNYGPYPIAIVKGERIYVTDVEGRQYMDFIAGFGSVNQGHSHPKIVQACIDQAPLLAQTSRAFINVHIGPFSEYICNLLGYDKFLPSSSGAEACESSVKLARRWGYTVKGVEHDKASVVCMTNNFWGRSITGSGACDDPIRTTNFGPFTPGFPLVQYNDVDAVEAYFQSDPNCVGIMIEPIQGEGGIVVPDNGYLKRIHDLCRKYNVLLISDEVQTGFGRTGKMLGCDWDLTDGVRADIITVAKSVSGGISPVSGILANDEVMMTVGPGDHGSTFGGNALGMAIARTAVEVLVEEDMIGNSLRVGAYLEAGLKGLKSPLIKEVRGRGLFLGLEFKEGHGIDGNAFAAILFKHGLLTKAARTMTVRFTPALVITNEEVDKAMDIIKESLIELEAQATGI